MVGFLIGRGGETIASLQAQSACKMQIQKEFDLQPGQTERIITLSAASQDAIDDCERRIMTMVEQRTREETQRNMPAGHTAVLQVPVPDSEVGLIIGKQGGKYARSFCRHQALTPCLFFQPPFDPSKNKREPTFKSPNKVIPMTQTHERYRSRTRQKKEPAKRKREFSPSSANARVPIQSQSTFPFPMLMSDSVSADKGA